MRHAINIRKFMTILASAAGMTLMSAGLASCQDASVTQGGEGRSENARITERSLQPTVLDMSNDAHRSYFLEHQRRAGSTLENDAHLAEFLELAMAHHAENGPPDARRVMLLRDGGRINPDTLETTTDPVGPVHTITSFQQDASNPKLYLTSALASVPDQPSTCTHTLVVEDEHGNPQGNGVQVRQDQSCEAVHLSTQGTLDDEDEWAQTVMTYYWVDSSGTPHSGSLSAAGSSIPTQITSTDPRDINGDGMIKFCFGREGADCDYKPAGASATNVYLPIVGNATYSLPIQNPATDPEASVYIAISHPEPETGGGCTLQGDVSTFLSTYVTLSNSDMQVNWNDPNVHFTTIDSSCMPNGSIVYYTMSMNIGLSSGGGRLPVFFGISSSPDTPVSTGMWVQLPSTRIYYSCVAEGTEITLANGQSRAIETLDVDDRIRSNRDGQAMTIYSTYHGQEAFMVRLTTQSGRELLISETHPVAMADAIRLAGEIQAGQYVRTLDGPERVTSADRVAYNGVVRNLSVGTAADDIALTTDNTTYFANGILVGDNEMQWIYASERRRSILAETGPRPIQETRRVLNR